MPAFSFTVGSLGDFLALGELIVRLGIALYKPGEATKDYEELKQELELLCQALGKIEICKGQKRSAIADGCLKAVQAQATACEKIIQDFLEKRKEPNTSLWNRICWTAKGPNEAADLRQRLSAHRETMSLLLEILLSQQLSEVMTIYEAGVKDMHAIIQHRPLQLTLVDAIGNYRFIPFDFCFTYEMFSDVLRAYYNHQKLPGSDWVKRGDYTIVSGSNHQVVRPSHWKSTITPGSIVEMSMILRRYDENGSKCPICGQISEGSSINGWTNCVNCDAQFQVTFEETERNEIVSPGAAAVPGPITNTSRNISNLSALSSTVGSTMRGLIEEWKNFRLLSIIASKVVQFQDSIRDPEGAIKYWKNIIHLPPDDLSDKPVYLNDLGEALQSRKDTELELSSPVSDPPTESERMELPDREPQMVQPECSFPCQRCSARFSRKQDRDHHERAIHTETEPYICAGCNKGFVRSDARVGHWRIAPQCHKLPKSLQAQG